MTKHFFLAMSFAYLIIVSYGFGQTIGDTLIHPETPTPAIVYIHAAVFFTWVILLIVQNCLVNVRKVAIHRKLGWFGVVLGSVMPLLGIATAYTVQLQTKNHAFFAVSLNDMLAFALLFGSAIIYRKQPAWHRRLMLLASNGLMVAAFARFPFVPGAMWAYVCVDLLIAIAILRDMIVDKAIHPAYRKAVPCIIAAQGVALYLAMVEPPFWLNALGVIF